MLKRYRIDTPAQLRTLHALRPDKNLRMAKLARAWHYADVVRSANADNPPQTSMACITFDTRTRKATVWQTTGGREIPIGTLGYNKALQWCRDNLQRTDEDAHTTKG